ncbi:acyl-CoA-binding protein [soil metagenome]
MELTEQFELATTDSKTLSKKPDNITLLKLYSLYKQATIGDVNTEAPSNAFDFVGNAKFKAWQELNGKPKELAMKEYVDLVNSLK